METNKQVKLSEVYSELANIKSQLNSLTQPTNNQSNNSTLVKINIMQSGQSSPHNKSYEKHANKASPCQIPQKYCYERPPKTANNVNNAQKSALKSPENDTFRSKQPPNEIQAANKKKNIKEGFGEYAAKAAQRLKRQLKCIPKIQFSPSKPQIQTPNQSSPPKNNYKKPLHIRHMSSNESKQLVCQFQNESNFAKHRYQPQRQMFTFKNNNETVQDSNPKRLKRMRSDFTGFPLSNVNDTKFKPFSLGDKVKDLEEELNRKDEAIKVLCSELCFFENSFKELEETLWNVIRNYSGKAKKKDVDIAQALKEVFSDMELQSAQLARLHIECQKWRKLNLQQEENIQKLQQRLRNVGKSDESILKLKSECDKYKQERNILASKLQVSVGENQLKDEFIVKVLSNKNSEETQKSKETTEMLKIYMNTCNYPRNRLLQKLTEETSQIERLKVLLSQQKK